jgi:hypothetical protein
MSIDNIIGAAGSQKVLRPTFFKVTPPADGHLSSLSSHGDIKIKAVTTPTSTLSAIDIPYKGRKIKTAGTRTFDTWTITILYANDDLRREFQKWIQDIQHSENIGQPSATASKLFEDWTITLLNLDGTDSAHIWKLVGCWPAELGEVTLDQSDGDAISEFTVTMQYTYFSKDEITTG